VGAAAAWADQATVRRPGEEILPVLPPLRALFADAGLRRGSVLAVEAAGALSLSLVAGASASGAWSALVGMPDAGVLAAARMGVDLERLLLVDEPGERWPEITAALLDAVEVVLVRPPGRPQATVERRLSALARRTGAVLIVAGGWEGAALRLRVASAQWLGLGDGHGHLQGRRALVVAEGRGGAVRPRVARLWLPAPDGTVTAADVLTSPADLTPPTALIPQADAAGAVAVA
jgi:hypothetical protein